MTKIAPSESIVVDDYTKEVTEGIYTFDKSSVKAQCKLDDRATQERRVLKYILLMLVVGGLVIGTLGSSVVTTMLLQQCKP